MFAEFNNKIIWSKSLLLRSFYYCLNLLTSYRSIWIFYLFYYYFFLVNFGTSCISKNLPISSRFSSFCQFVFSVLFFLRFLMVKGEVLIWGHSCFWIHAFTVLNFTYNYLFHLPQMFICCVLIYLSQDVI